ncbi:hypothetical protein D1BOALGB6SA_6298 [Olavius sp. associated proteobacterium Delta 1]|nr:hypothetical protein D1BOALGB6SA_6298 [Olavius sp. associated proteobacterium Delta 1]
MKKSKQVITRRDFIRTSSYVAMGSLMGLPLTNQAVGSQSAKSRVVLVRDKKLADSSGALRAGRLSDMLDQAIMVLLETSDSGSAWQRLFVPEDVVGIKSNVWWHLPTPAALNEILQQRLLEVGLEAQHIAVDDRGVLRNPIFKNSTALINVRPMRTHAWSGLGTLLKNYIMFVPSPSMYHGNACEKLGAIWQKPHVTGKTRLNILVMITPLFHGVGPHHFSRKYTWPYNGLIVSADPVAADATGARIIQVKRNDYFGKERLISPRPLHIEAADTRFGLGNSHSERIELIKLGWDEDILI